MKTTFEKPGNFLYPVPAVMVSCRDDQGKPNIITVAWAGTVCSDPPMLSISVRKSRYSHELIRKTGGFVVNLTTEKLVKAADFCGVRSGREVDKFRECGLTPGKGKMLDCPTIEESPVSLECRVKQVLELGSHDLFLAEVVCVQAEDRFLDEKGRFHMEETGLTAYSHGTYYSLGHALGTFGFSVKKTVKKQKGRKHRKGKS